MKPIFTAEDFKSPVAPIEHWRDEIAKQANEKLNNLIESWPVVYGNDPGYKNGNWGQETEMSGKFKARLAFIEPIVKEKCKHRPSIMNMDNTKSTSICLDCGKPIVGTWKEG